MVIESKLICRILGVNGICLWPFIFVDNKKDATLLNHENIHLQQEKELFVIPFYILYIYYYIRNIIELNHISDWRARKYIAYKAIPFERESYANERDSNYIRRRNRMGWKKYV